MKIQFGASVVGIVVDEGTVKVNISSKGERSILWDDDSCSFVIPRDKADEWPIDRRVIVTVDGDDAA